MISNTNLRRLIAYYNATKNEIAIDVSAYSLFNKNPENEGFIPRPSIYINKTATSGPLIKTGLRFLRYIWYAGLGHVFFAKQLLTYLTKLNKQSTEYVIKPNSKIGLAFSVRATEIISESILQNVPITWITFPWVSSEKIPDRSNKYSMFSLLSLSDLYNAYKLAALSLKHFARYNKSNNWILQTYTAFQWFCARLALEKLDNEFYIAEHFDRWAVLADTINLEGKRKNKFNLFHLVQHGLVGSLNEENKFILPYKLKSVTNLNVYDETSARYFVSDILDSQVMPKVEYYKSVLSLTNLNDTDVFKILFVGSPLCETAHLFFNKQLKLKYKYYAFYKPHPLTPPSAIIKTEDWEIIMDKSTFPVVDLVISYPSTLATEYQMLGVAVLVHPLNVLNEKEKDFLNAIEKLLSVTKAFFKCD